MRARTLAGLLVVFAFSGASAERARANIGVLTCTLAKGVEVKQGEMTCGFKPTGTGQEEKFVGSLQGAAPQGAKLVLIWAVLGPADAKISGGLLAQKYVRAKTAAGHPPSWIGQKNDAIVLQFESNDATRANFAIGEIELRLTGTAA